MKLMVIDGNSIVNRAYYGIRPLTNQEGLHTNAIYGFLTTLQRLLEEEKPEALCVTFDVHAPTFRHEADEAYKATRKGMDPELREQMPVLKEVLDAMQIPRYELAGWEADDLIGTIARKCEAKDWECVVVTGDKDSLQLITPKTKVKLASGKGDSKDMTVSAFEEIYGFAPIHMIDLKALMGDASDNIAGVKGIGEKTAMALLHQYESVEKLYQAMPAIDAKPGVIKKLQEGEGDARHSYWLATIATNAPLDFAPEMALRKEPAEALYPLFLRLEFTKLIDKWNLRPEVTPVAEDTIDHHVTMEALTTVEQGETALARWRSAPWVAVSALPDLSGVCVDCQTSETESVLSQVFFDSYQGDFSGFLAAVFSADIAKVAHNVKDFMGLLLENKLPIAGFVYDTALAAYLLDATAGNYALSRLFTAYYNAELPKPIHLEADAFSMLGDNAASCAAFASYTTAVGAIYETTVKKLEERGQMALLQEIELPLCAVLAEMEQTGCAVDGKALQDFGVMLAKEIDTLEATIYDQAGHSFNINSPKQLGVVLFDELGLPHGKKTKTGWSTNAEVLDKLSTEHAIVSQVLSYRQLAKLKSTYADGLVKAIANDGRIHSSFQMTVTATGRLSSTEPNLQNIPTRTELGSEIRRMFVGQEDWVLVDADYSQIELRVLAHMAGDSAMAQAFTSGTDIHTATASQVFGVAPESVTSELRRRAKAVNFGIVYGISPFSLSQDIDSTVAEAKGYIAAYLDTFSGVSAYMKNVVEQAKIDGYVETLYHRRRDLPELSASNFIQRSFGERVALNMPIQGTAADVMKLSMIAVWKRLKAEDLQARLVLQVHDELIVECPPSEAETVARLLEEEMAGVCNWSVPLTAEAHWGKNWKSAKG